MNPFERLMLPPDATKAEVKRRFYELAQTAHPDAGGTVEQFVVLKEIYERALLIAEEVKLCPACQGRGKLKHTRGFASIELTCPACSGVVKSTTKAERES